MARFWPIPVVVLVIFLAATVECARTSESKAIPKKTHLEKLKNLVSSAVQDFRTVGSNFKTLNENVDLISKLATEQLQSCFRAFELLEQRRKPAATTLLPNVTKSPTTTQQPVVTTTKTGARGDKWTKYGRGFYSFSRCTQQCSFDSARKKCMEKQARLAKCNSRELENFFVLSLNTSYYILLGGNDRDEEGTWRWPDESLLNASYTNWYTGEPGGGTGQNCLFLDVRTRKWFDEPCDHLYSAYDTSFVCEKKGL